MNAAVGGTGTYALRVFVLCQRCSAPRRAREMRTERALLLATLAAANSQLAFSLPPWPEDKSPWRYLLRCRSSSLQDLSSSGTLLY